MTDEPRRPMRIFGQLKDVGCKGCQAKRKAKHEAYLAKLHLPPNAVRGHHQCELCGKANVPDGAAVCAACRRGGPVDAIL